MTMDEHVARVICRASATGNGVCRHCGDSQRADGTVDLGDCNLWPSFAVEAACAIEGVRDCAMLTTRRKPRFRRPIDVRLEVHAAIQGAGG